MSEAARTQLITLKRRTGIRNWNVLCRWAFCLSLSEAHSPVPREIRTDSSVEMTWPVFAGQHQDAYLALLIQRCHEDGVGVDDETLAAQFRLHLHRGISQMAAMRDLDLRSLVALATNGNGEGA